MADLSWALTWSNVQEIFRECEQRGFPCAGFHHGIFIETGTFLGQTVVALSPHFSELHTIELSQQCFEAAKLFAWKAARPIHYHLGNSTNVLKSILPKVSGPAVLYLDAHWSGSVTKGLKDEIPLMKELSLIIELLPHASLVIIDDLDLFAKINSFEAIDGETGIATGRHSADWRSITCDSLQMSCSSRAHGSFKLKTQNRFIMMLHPCGGRSADTPNFDSKQLVDRPMAAFCQDLVLRSMYSASGPGGQQLMMDLTAPVETVWISIPGSALQSEGLEKVRAQGRWWKQIADAIEKEYSNGLGYASNTFKTLQGRMQEERVKTARLCEQSVENTLTRDKCIALHDDLIQTFLNEAFQKKLAAAWAAAKGDKAKEQKCKRELCLPFQLPIMEKYGFEKSEKGVFKCLWSVRTTFFNFKAVEEVDEEMKAKAVFLDFLVSPGKDLHPDLIPFARSIFPGEYAAVCEIRAQALRKNNQMT